MAAAIGPSDITDAGLLEVTKEDITLVSLIWNTFARDGTFNADLGEAMQLVARHRIAAGKQALEEAAKVFTDAIEQGYDPRNQNKGKCEHDKYYFEECIACYDEHLLKAIRKLIDE